jgi:hypothetical protein
MFMYVSLSLSNTHTHTPQNNNKNKQTNKTEARRELHRVAGPLLWAGRRVRHVWGGLGGRLRPAAEGGTVRGCLSLSVYVFVCVCDVHIYI